MIVEDIAEIGEETHIWIGDKLVFNGRYQKNNSYTQKKVSGVGYDEEIDSELLKVFRAIELDE